MVGAIRREKMGKIFDENEQLTFARFDRRKGGLRR
jgi:hypothetical protein